jgi:hypothetical protein
LAHPDFIGRTITSKSFVTEEDAQDGNGHGTHCIGTACGSLTSNLPHYGVAYAADVFAGKVLSDEGNGSDGGILAGINWAIANRCQFILFFGVRYLSCMDKLPPKQLVKSIYQQLLPRLQIESVNPRNPIQVSYLPQPWRLLGKGNYAAVVYHPNHPECVVKIYAPGRPGFEEEVEVYRRLGSHPAFSECLYAKDSFLILKRLYGTTLYDCMHLGLPIPKQVIRDIDEALDYARRCSLHPHDVHGRNVMMHQGRGLVVDISDFLHLEACSKWNDLKKAYYWLYRPVLRSLRLHVPYSALNMLRKSYRLATSLKTSCCRLVLRLTHFKCLKG